MNYQGTGQNLEESTFNTVPRPRSFQVAGIDGCKAGWFVAVISAIKGIYASKEEKCKYSKITSFYEQYL